MKNLKVFTIVAVMALISLGMFVSCQKENVVQNGTILVKQQKSVVFPPDILAFIEEYIVGGYVNKEHTVIGENGLVYSLFIMDEDCRLLEWREKQEVEEKIVHTFEHSSGLLVGISWKENPFVITMPADFPFSISVNGNYLTIGNYTFYVVDGKDIEDEIIDGDEDGGMVCYGLKITRNEEKLRKWIQKQWDKGKEVYITEIIDCNGEFICWVGVSKNPK